MCARVTDLHAFGVFIMLTSEKTHLTHTNKQTNKQANLCSTDSVEVVSGVKIMLEIENKEMFLVLF